MKNAAIFEKVSRRLHSYRDEIIELQTKLTSIPALGPENAGEGEKAKAEFLKTVLAKIPVDEVIELNASDARVPCGYRPNLLATVEGKKKSKKIWLLSHMDIVPPGELSLWNSDPYIVSVKDGRLYGRGVEDNQQGMVASIMALKALRDEGIQPEYTVGLALVADEETGNTFGLRHILDTKKELFDKNDIIIVPDSGNEDGTMVEVAEKSILWIEFRIIGKQCHGSRPGRGINAHKAAAFLTVDLNELYSFFDISDPVFAPPTSTFEPTKRESNVPNINTIPGEDIFYFDCRVLPNYSLSEIETEVRKIVQRIEKKFGVKVELSFPQREEAAPPTPTDAPVVHAISTALKEIRGIRSKPMGIGGGTVAALFRHAGFYAAVWETIDKTAHQPNEYCLLDNLLADASVFAHIFLQE